MAFDWSSLKAGPKGDEVEITVFGPGFGECCVLHVGEGHWVIVDSCIDSADQDDKRPVSERYLRTLGVDISTQVDLVVATHWHSDHVRGIGRVVSQATSADFCCASALLNAQFITYVEQISTAASATDGAKVSDFREAIRAVRDRGTVARFALGNRTLKTWNSGNTIIRSLSPSDTEFEIFLRNIAAKLPRHGEPKKSAPSQQENLCAVVLQLQSPHFSVLLGADMEVHHDSNRGWNAIVAEAGNAALLPSTVWKVPHHGSINGHHEDTWRVMLTGRPTSVATPFNKLPHTKKLPTPEDVSRIADRSSALYVTAPPVRQALKGLEPSVVRSLRESQIEIRKAATDLGVVRIRWSPQKGWATELFGAAYKA